MSVLLVTAILFAILIAIAKVKFERSVRWAALENVGHHANDYEWHVEQYGPSDRWTADFANRWSISVISGEAFYSRPSENTFELAMVDPSDDIYYDSEKYPYGVEGWQTREEVEEAMRYIAHYVK